MLLNEIKRIFEVDRDALQDTLADFNIRTDFEGFNRSNKKPGDLHPSVKDILNKSIIAAEYVVPSKGELEALTSTIEIKNRTLDSLHKLLGSLIEMKKHFTEGLTKLAKDLVPVATPDDKIETFIQNTLDNLERESSTIRSDSILNVKNILMTKRYKLTDALMKESNARSYSNETLEEIKNFLKSSQWFEKDGATVKMSGVTTIKGWILNFYTATDIFQRNTNLLIGQVTAINKT